MGDVERRIQASALVLVSWETMRSARRRGRAEGRRARGFALQPVPEAEYTNLHLTSDRHATLTLCGRRLPEGRGLAFERGASPFGAPVPEGLHAGGCVTCAVEAATLTGDHGLGEIEVLRRTRGGAAARAATTCSCGWREEFTGVPATWNSRMRELHRDHVVRICREALGVRDEEAA